MATPPPVRAPRATARPELTPEEIRHEAKIEAVAQALAVIGRAEGEHRVLADGDSKHPAFLVAERLREVAIAIRNEMADPTGRSTLEIAARSDEASELSAYVLEVSNHYQAVKDPKVAMALSSVAGDIRKGSEGVGKLRLASDINTEPSVLDDLMKDEDQDVRWWAAQNPATTAETLVSALATEQQTMVLTAVLVHPHLPTHDAAMFVNHPVREVSAAARSRLGL